MVARAEILGDTGANHPDNWIGGLASSDLHAIVILFARDAQERQRCEAEHQRLVAQCEEWKYSRHLIWRQRRHSSMRMTTSVTATGCRNRSSREQERSRH